MTANENQPKKNEPQNDYPVATVKVVAELPGDEKMRDELKEMKEHDGYPGSCGV